MHRIFVVLLMRNITYGETNARTMNAKQEINRSRTVKQDKHDIK